jgi:hypothetical protein
MMREIIWDNGEGRKIIRDNLVNGGYVYFIVFDESEIKVYEKTLLEMCQAVMQDKEREE